MAESRYEGSRFELIADPEDLYYRYHCIDMVILAYPEVTVRGPVSHVAVSGFPGLQLTNNPRVLPYLRVPQPGGAIPMVS